MEARRITVSDLGVTSDDKVDLLLRDGNMVNFQTTERKPFCQNDYSKILNHFDGCLKVFWAPKIGSITLLQVGPSSSNVRNKFQTVTSCHLLLHFCDGLQTTFGTTCT